MLTIEKKKKMLLLPTPAQSLVQYLEWNLGKELNTLRNVLQNEYRESGDKAQSLIREASYNLGYNLEI